MEEKNDDISVTDKKLTGYPSIDKPWLKYYSQEAIVARMPQCTIYEYLWANNKDYPNDIALEYMGNKISYGELFRHIDESAKALVALGVKVGDIVTVALPSIPEALYVVYAINRIGAVANMIHPLAGEKELLNYLNEVKSEVAVIFEGSFSIIGGSIDSTAVKRAIVVSAGDSLPLGIKQLYMLKNRLPRFVSGGIFMNWKQFIINGKNVVVQQEKKDSSSLAIISLLLRDGVEYTIMGQEL